MGKVRHLAGHGFLKSLQGVRYIHVHQDDSGSFSKTVHQLSIQLLGVILHPNCGWEFVEREDTVEQLSRAS